MMIWWRIEVTTHQY